MSNNTPHPPYSLLPYNRRPACRTYVSRNPSPSELSSHPALLNTKQDFFVRCFVFRRSSRRAVFAGYDVPRERERGKDARQIPRRHPRQPGPYSENRYVHASYVPISTLRRLLLLAVAVAVVVAVFFCLVVCGMLNACFCGTENRPPSVR